MSGIIIMPTMGRPQNITRFIQAYADTQARTPIVMVLDDGDPKLKDYNAINYPLSFTRLMVPHGTTVPQCQNIAFELFPDKDYYGFIGDDCVPETRDWDWLLGNACQPNGIAWGDDGIQGEGLTTHPFIAGKLLRKIGYVAHPSFHHFFTDTVLLNIVRTLNCGVYLPNIKTTHYHHLNGKAEMDETYTSKGSLQRDFDNYNEFNRTEFPRLIERLRA